MAVATAVDSNAFVEPIRNVSRQLVRELGFMKKTLANTSYPPSAVHTLLEIGDGSAETASQLSHILNLSDSSIVQTLSMLVDAEEVQKPQKELVDVNETLSLTSRGRQSVDNINIFARDQVSKALDRVHRRDAETILQGLELYAATLYAQRTGKSNVLGTQVEIVNGYQPGIVGRAVEMHINFYSRAVGFGAYFESQLAIGLGNFVSRLNSTRNQVWTAKLQDKIVGTIFVDGEDLGHNYAHLRAFIVDDGVRGGGAGRRLLAKAIEFVDQQQFEETYLWTFQGLDAARRLYEFFGFRLKKEFTGTQWGKEVTEQLFVRPTRHAYS